MSRQYLRKLSVVLANDQEALELSALKCVFHIRQSDLQTPNNVVLTVYNVSEATQERAEKEFTRLVIQAGYEDGPFGTIFDGSIVQAYAGRENATDTFLKVVGGDGDQGYNFAVVNRSLAAGSTAQDQWSAVGAALAEQGVKQGYVPDNLPGNALPRGKVMFGMARDHARQLAETHGLNWSIQNRQLQAVRKDAYLPGPAVVITAKTGMVGLPQRTQDGIRVRCLLNPELRVARPIQLDNRSIQNRPVGPSIQGERSYLELQSQVRLSSDGFYRVLVVDHVGDSRGNDWYSDIIAIALRDSAPLSQAQLGRV